MSLDGRYTTLDALRFLARRCDGARSWDGAGFNKFDSDFGKSLAELESLTENRERAAIKMLKKYRGQLADGEIVWEDLALQFGERMRSKDSQPTATAAPPLRIDVAGDRFVLFSPYDPEKVDAMRLIPDREWFGRDRQGEPRFFMGHTNVWTVTIDHPLEVEAYGLRFGFTFTDEARRVIDGHRRVAEAELARVEQLVAASKAQDADIVLKIDTNRSDRLRLRPFQRAGAQYILDRRRTFVADEMGLGKTVEALAAVEEDGVFPGVVICPKTVAAKWVREIRRWLPHRSVQRMHNGGRFNPDVEITVVHYDVLPKALEVLTAQFKWLVVDESHNVKNEGTKKRPVRRTQLVQYMADRLDGDDPMILAMSGTPGSNGRPAELISQLNIIRRLKDLGGYHHYWKRFCGESSTGRMHMHELNTQLRANCYLRRLKKDVMPELPPRVFAPVPVDIDNEVEYKFAERRFLEWVRSIGGDVMSARRAEVLARLTALRHLAARGKMTESIQWIHEFLDEEPKLVVFAHHRDIQQGVFAACQDYNPRMITGGQSEESATAAWTEFQEDDSIRVIVVALEKGGEGIDLFAASNAVFLELPWTPKGILQAIDRLHRLGQEDSVTGWQLLAPGTIDDFMQELLAEKMEDFEDMHDGMTADTDGGVEVSVAGGVIDRMMGREEVIV